MGKVYRATSTRLDRTAGGLFPTMPRFWSRSVEEG